MSTDQLLDAHMQRLRTDPGYVAIWRRAHEQPNMGEIVMMLAWAEQADGLREMAQHAETGERIVGVECPRCGCLFGVKVEGKV